jgi:hypothetical protein
VVPAQGGEAGALAPFRGIERHRNLTDIGTVIPQEVTYEPPCIPGTLLGE